MPNYQDGYIYKLWSLQTEEIYIGSSTTEPRKRLYDHKKKYNLFSQGKYKGYYTSYKIVQYPDCKIEIIENYPCNSKAELCKREGEHQRATKCCNKTIEGRTRKEHYEDNIEKIKEYREKNKNAKAKTMKIYREKNKEKISIEGKEYRAENKEAIAKRQKEWREKNKDRISNQKKEYHEKNKEAILKRNRERYQKNKEAILKRRRELKKEKEKSNIKFLKIKIIKKG